MILSNFFKCHYGKERNLSFTASLTFEQSYGEIDGDSASTAELIAIMSAIADVPIKQSIAITGAINQLGVVQAVGGINEKIEGFFDVCQQRGLNGEHGVILPTANIHHLMLKQSVVDACKEKKFSIYAVDTVDEVIEILSNLPAGEMDNDGNYPEDTFNGKVQTQLIKFTKLSDDEEDHDENHDHEHTKKSHHDKVQTDSSE